MQVGVEKVSFSMIGGGKSPPPPLGGCHCQQLQVQWKYLIWSRSEIPPAVKSLVHVSDWLKLKEKWRFSKIFCMQRVSHYTYMQYFIHICLKKVKSFNSQCSEIAPCCEILPPTEVQWQYFWYGHSEKISPAVKWGRDLPPPSMIGNNLNIKYQKIPMWPSDQKTSALK